MRRKDAAATYREPLHIAVRATGMNAGEDVEETRATYKTRKDRPPLNRREFEANLDGQLCFAAGKQSATFFCA